MPANFHRHHVLFAEGFLQGFLKVYLLRLCFAVVQLSALAFTLWSGTVWFYWQLSCTSTFKRRKERQMRWADLFGTNLSSGQADIVITVSTG